MQTFWKKSGRELYRRTTLTVAQTWEMTDEELEDTMWEAARPWEDQWEALKVNESKSGANPSRTFGGDDCYGQVRC